MMKMPDKVRPGEPVEAETLNEVIDLLRAVMIQPGRGYSRSISPGGTVLRIRDNTRNPLPQEYPPFALIEADKQVGGDYEVTLEPGRVRCTNPPQSAGGGDGWDVVVPTIGGTGMDVEDVNGDLPTITVPVGKAIYCKIERDSSGFLVGTPTMEVDDPGKDAMHYQPPDPGASGTDEQHQWVPILEIDEDVNGVLEVTVWRKSDIECVNQLWVGENLGTGGEVYKAYDEAAGKYQYRSVSGRFGTETAQGASTINVDFDGENLANLTGGTTAEVYVEPTPAEIAAGGKAEFRPITQGPSGRREISVDESGDVVRVYGNGANGSFSINGIVYHSWTDGLVQENANIDATIEELPSGSSGEILYHDGTDWTTLANPGNPSPNEAWQLFHDGTSPYWDPVV